MAGISSDWPCIHTDYYLCYHNSFFLFWVGIHNVGISCNTVGLIYKNIVSKQILSQYIEKQGGIKTLAKYPG